MTKSRNSYQLHIQLCDTKPAIWRRLVVAESMTLAQLHRAIQAVMGWQNRHQYEFEIAGQRYGQPDADLPDDPTMDARRYTLGQLLQGQALTVRYLYNFGDGWMHRIKLESVQPIASPAALHSLPMCMGGRNACPPENCGGPQRYADLLSALEDIAHPQQPAARAQAAGFDAKHFDLQRAQARVHSLALLGANATVTTTKVETALA